VLLTGGPFLGFRSETVPMILMRFASHLLDALCLASE
jgi:hypothetical protein